LLVICFTAVLAIIALPTLASAQGATIEAKGSGPFEWSPNSVSVGEGASVAIKNPSAGIPHGVQWNVVPVTPSCTGVPGTAGEPSSGTSWSGTCTFSKPGEYTFYCTVHGPSMSGRVIVGAPAEPAPIVTRVSPGKGPTTGGTAVTITGSNLAAATAVHFGAIPATSFHASSATTLTAVAPEQAAGRVDVTVTTPGGTSATVKKDRFKYRAPRKHRGGARTG
jgi:plastocyanin